MVFRILAKRCRRTIASPSSLSHLNNASCGYSGHQVRSVHSFNPSADIDMTMKMHRDVAIGTASCSSAINLTGRFHSLLHVSARNYATSSNDNNNTNSTTRRKELLLTADCKSKTYFALFGLEESVLVDEAELQRQYHAMQALLHPDKHPNASSSTSSLTDSSTATGAAATQRLPGNWIIKVDNGITNDDLATLSATCNAAYRVLKSPFSRTRYLLTLKTQESTWKVNNSFLMNMMEITEDVFNTDNSTKEGKEHLQKVKENLQQESEQYFRRAVNCWHNDQCRDVDCLRKVVAEWVYVHNLIEKIIDMQ